MYLVAMIIWKGGLNLLFDFQQQCIPAYNSMRMTMVMIRRIDISGGGITALVTMVCVVYLEDHGGTVQGLMLIALGIGLAFGLIHGILVSYFEIQPLSSLWQVCSPQGMITIVSTLPVRQRRQDFET